MTRRYWGSESASYHPALLLGCWCTAIRRECLRAGSWNVRPMNSVAVWFITTNGHPDHDTIATVGRRFLREIEGLIVRVLELAREMGLLKLGTAADQTRVGVPAGGGGRYPKVRVSAITGMPSAFALESVSALHRIRFRKEATFL